MNNEDMLKFNSFEDLVKNLIKIKLDEYVNNSIYGCELAYTLFEGENVDGSLTCNAYYFQEIIKKYFDEFGEIYDNFIFNSGKENSINCFEEPETFVVIMLLEKANDILSQLDFISKNWDNEIELNQKNINIIKKELEK